MNASPTTWIFVIPGFLHFLFYVAALLFVMFKQSDQSSAKTFAVLAIVILLFSKILGVAASFVLARYFVNADYAFFYGINGLVGTVLHLLAMSLLIAAVFTGRSSDPQPDSLGKLTPGPSDNPYSPPVS